MFCPPLCFCLGYQPSIRNAFPAWDQLLFIYAILGVPVLFSILVGLNLLVWARLRINYGFIFGEKFGIPFVKASSLGLNWDCRRTRHPHTSRLP